MKKHILFAGVAAGLALACALPASAQSIDYGSLEELFNEPVTTSATGSPQRSTEAPADMQIISAEDIRRSGAVDLPTILQQFAGMDVLSFTAGQTDVSVRGYNQISSPRLLVLVNGRQVYLDHYGVTVWRTIPVQLDEIRQIEVVKGPNSALFGFNAVSGVVNIITYNPKFDDKNAVTVRGGNDGYGGGSIVASAKLGERFSARLSAGAERQDEWGARAGVLPTQLHDPHNVSASLDTVAQLTPKTELRTEGSWSNVQQSSASGTSLAVTKFISSSIKTALSSETQFGLIEASAYQNRLNAKYTFGSQFDWENTISVLSLQDIFKVGAAHTFRVGGEFRDNSLNTAPVGGGEIKYKVYAASGMWNWAVTDSLATTVAVRVDNLKLSRSGTFPDRFPRANNALWDREITETSLNLAAVWRPTAEDTLRASYARGVQAPSLIELGGLQLSTAAGPMTLALVGNPGLEPSIVTNYQLSYDRELTALKAKASVRLFWQNWDGIRSGFTTSLLDIMPTATTNGGITYANTVSDSEMKGVELAASGKASQGFRWSADYTYTDVEDKPMAGMDLTARFAAFEETTPKSRGNVALGWADDHWEVDANLHYVGKFEFYAMPGSTLETVDGFATLSGRVGYRLENGLTFAVSGKNLLKDEQKQSTGLLAERRVIFSVSKSW
jgi:outer membrane receptor for ferrienterochelin and colicins